MKTTQPLRGKSKNLSISIFLFYEFRKVNQHDPLFLPQADWFFDLPSSQRQIKGNSKSLRSLRLGGE
jgi:hypothetical protein